MDKWIQAIYDATGIPLSEADLTLAFRERQWWLVLHRHPVLPVGANPDPHEAVTPAARAALARGMKLRLSETIPRVQRLLDAQDAERARDVEVAVVNAEGRRSLDANLTELERGWPHFLLRLSTGGFDVAVDLNPYVPDDPFELDEVKRLAGVILQVARST